MFGIADFEKQMQAIKESTHEIVVRSDQHAYDKDARDDESDDEVYSAVAKVPAYLL